MPRRMKVARADLPRLVLDAAERFAAQEGLRGITMRRLARDVGVVPGSIYNFVGDIDDVVVRLKARILGQLRVHLQAAVDPRADASRNALALADAYLEFVQANARLWSVIIEHSFSADRPIPDWYEEELGRTLAVADGVVEPLVPDPGERKQAVLAIWAALHGVASLSVAGKLTTVSGDGRRTMARRLVARYLGIPAD